MESEVFSSVFHNTTTIVDDTEEDNPCEEDIRNALDKALDDDIEDDEEWCQDENIAPNNHSNNHSNNQENVIHKSNVINDTKTSSKNSGYNSHINVQNNVKHAYQHNAGHWPGLPQPPQPLHPYLKVNPYAMPGPYHGPYPPFPPYSFHPPQNYAGFDSATYDSRDSSETGGGNNTEQLSRDDYYPVGADKSEWDNSYSEKCGSPECGGSLPLDSEVFTNDGSDAVINEPEQLNALYRANQRKLDQITRQLQDTQNTYTKQIHSLQHKVGLLQTEKNILETQLSQSALRTKELEEVADKEKYEKEQELRAVAQLNDKILSMELQLQERSSEIDRLSYQLKDTVPKKESDYYQQMMSKVNKVSEQQLTDIKKKLDACKRDIVHKDLEIEKLKVELQNSVKDKITGIETDMKQKEEFLKRALEDLLITLPKINMIDVNLPLVTEVHSSDISELTSHISTITQRLCDSEDSPSTLTSRIVDLKNECEMLRHTAAQLQNRVVTSERTEQEAISSIDSKDRTISHLQREVVQLQEKLNHLHEAVNESEQRADQAIAREREAMERIADAERRCEQTLVDQTNTLKRMRSMEETSRLDRQGLENKVEEYRLQISSNNKELDKNKELYVSLSKDKINLQKDYEKRLENFQQKATDELISQLDEIKVQYKREREQFIVQKEEDMLLSFAQERQEIESQIMSRMSEEYEKKLELELENSQKQWSGSTNVSTLCILEMTHVSCQTDNLEIHFTKIWQRERESELALARETSVALARAGWDKDNEKTIRNRVDFIIKAQKEEWLNEGSKANGREVEELKQALKEAVNRTEEMRRKIEQEYRNNLSKTNSEYKSEINRLLQIERENYSKSEKRCISVQVELDQCKEQLEALRVENRDYIEGQMKHRHEVEKLTDMFEKVKNSENLFREQANESKKEFAELRRELRTKMDERSQKESLIRSQCETVIYQMKAELLKYAENANQQAMDYVKKAIMECKEATAAKYKKYYQRLLYCLVEKHPTIKSTVKHLQQTLPKQVARTPLRPDQTLPRSTITPSSHQRLLHSTTVPSSDSPLPRPTPTTIIELSHQTDASNDSGLPPSQETLHSQGPGHSQGYLYSQPRHLQSDRELQSSAVCRKLHLRN